MCVGLVASSTEEMAARSIAYHAHGTPDGDKYCCYPWLVCHDIKSAMLAQARPRMINHLTSFLLCVRSLGFEQFCYAINTKQASTLHCCELSQEHDLKVLETELKGLSTRLH